MPLNVQGILESVSLGNETETRLDAYIREVFINEAPLLTRLPREQAEAPDYNIVTYDIRQRLYAIGGAVLSGDATVTVADTTPFLLGDVIEMFKTDGTAIERMEVTAINSSTVLAVKRAQEGTTAQANSLGGASNTLNFRLIGNSRTGSEVNQNATRQVRTDIPQHVQTFQFPVQIGGLAQAMRNVVLPNGQPDLFTFEQKTQLTQMIRDVEYTMCYGIGNGVTNPGDRRRQTGLRGLIGWYNGGNTPAAGSNVNVTTNGGGSFTLNNFTDLGLTKALMGGGDPDVCICGLKFNNGLQTWGYGKQQIVEPEMTEVGLPIEKVCYPFGSKPITFIPSFQLDPYTAILLTSKDVKIRQVRPEFWQRRGIRGDALEGDLIADLCIEIGHPGWHAWIEGITSFA